MRPGSGLVCISCDQDLRGLVQAYWCPAARSVHPIARATRGLDGCRATSILFTLHFFVDSVCGALHTACVVPCPVQCGSTVELFNKARDEGHRPQST